jgi:hypothetical protein
MYSYFREQASLRLLTDGFSIENAGTGVVSVNGLLIHTGKFAILTSGAMLDFCGTILLFITNRRLINEIMAEFHNVTD